MARWNLPDRLPSPLGWAEGLARRWRSGAPASTIICLVDSQPATVRNLSPFPALAIPRPRDSVLECVQPSAAFAVNQPVTATTTLQSASRLFPVCPGQRAAELATY